ncbi:hypothetical protein BJX64DRAFT_25836 [Aspergillus heterothallicus]
MLITIFSFCAMRTDKHKQLTSLSKLKRPQAQVWEARLAREGSGERRRQGRVILLFTFVTIIFARHFPRKASLTDVYLAATVLYVELLQHGCQRVSQRLLWDQHIMAASSGLWVYDWYLSCRHPSALPPRNLPRKHRAICNAFLIRRLLHSKEQHPIGSGTDHCHRNAFWPSRNC